MMLNLLFQRFLVVESMRFYMGISISHTFHRLNGLYLDISTAAKKSFCKRSWQLSVQGVLVQNLHISIRLAGIHIILSLSTVITDCISLNAFVVKMVWGSFPIMKKK